MRVGVASGTSWATTTPSTIVKEGYTTALGAFLGRNYDVSQDGQRFLVVKTPDDPNAAPPELVVVQHFDEELKRLVPTIRRCSAFSLQLRLRLPSLRPVALHPR